MNKEHALGSAAFTKAKPTERIKRIKRMEGKLKRIRFRKDGKIDFEFMTEDGQSVIAEGCTLHVEESNEATYG